MSNPDSVVTGTSIQVKSSQAVRLITAAIKAGIAPMLKGSPGIGKSQIVHQIAEDFNLEVIDIRLSQCDPTDLAGFPTIVDGKADYMPMKHFPIEGDPLPHGKSGWILFLDEATSAPAAIQAAAYKLVLDRMVGTHHLHKKLAIVLAGNLDTDGAIVHTMSTALQSRLAHLQLVLDNDDWMTWAEIRGQIHYWVTSFMKFKPGSLFTFSPDHTDCTYACPRTWEFVSKLLKSQGPEADMNDLKPLLSGIIGEGVAREFLLFCRIHEQLLKPAQILASPESVKVPSEPSILYALTGSIAHTMKLTNASDYMKFVNRLPVEFQVVCLRETIRRNKEMIGHEAIQKWVAHSAATLF